MKQRARSDQEKLAKKEIILEAAKNLFSRYGYQGTTIEMITEEAGLSPAAFYLYFKNCLKSRITSIKRKRFFSKTFKYGFAI